MVSARHRGRNVDVSNNHRIESIFPCEDDARFGGLFMGSHGFSSVDTTALTSRHDFSLTYLPDGAPPPSGPLADRHPPAPDISNALESQLGLRLEKRKVSVEMLVIDHIERTPLGIRYEWSGACWPGAEAQGRVKYAFPEMAFHNRYVLRTRRAPQKPGFRSLKSLSQNEDGVRYFEGLGLSARPHHAASKIT